LAFSLAVSVWCLGSLPTLLKAVSYLGAEIRHAVRAGE
jgi:hypothetical protein